METNMKFVEVKSYYLAALLHSAASADMIDGHKGHLSEELVEYVSNPTAFNNDNVSVQLEAVESLLGWADNTIPLCRSGEPGTFFHTAYTHLTNVVDVAHNETS